jgi:predicted nucleic acid-binding protein
MSSAGGSLLIDSDVLIDYLRGRQAAVAFLTALPLPLTTSAISSAELYAGVREDTERAQLDLFLRAFVVLPISADIAVMGGLFRRDFGKTHGTGLADALIAATVTVHHMTLVTLNQRHFPMLAHTHVPYSR